VNGDDQNNCRSLQTACSTIRHAISLAASGDTVTIAAATYSENLSVNINLKLIGSGAASTIIDGGGARVISIFNSTTIVGLSKVTIRNGAAVAGGGILNAGTLAISNSTVSRNSVGSGSSAAGGGIYNIGTLTIANSTLSGNSGNSSFMAGGAIYNSGTLTITNSTLSGNTVTSYGYIPGGGGGIYNSGTLTITNTTLSGNSAHGSGGSGIYNSAGSVTITNTTLYGNSAQVPGGGGIYNKAACATPATCKGSVAINNATLSGNTAAGKGGGIFVATGAKVTLQNSIVANSSTAKNCYGTLTSKGYNLSSDTFCTFHNSGDRNNIAPRLGPLQNNGGPTFTQALLSGSPAIDAGNPSTSLTSGCTDGKGHRLTTDQRGMPRYDKEDNGEVVKVGCDMGAYETSGVF
jgi:hypothetical protein